MLEMEKNQHFRLWFTSTSRCEVKLHRTWSTAASWSRTPDAPSFAPRTPMSSLFREQTLDLATGISRSRFKEFGTVDPPHCGSLTFEFVHFKRLLKTFLFGETAAH